MIVQPAIGDIVSILFRRKRLMSLTALTVAAAGAAYLLIVTPKYRSEAAVVVRFDQQAIPATSLARDSTPEVTASNERHEVVLAHSDILSSPDLARSVIESIGLKRMYPDIVEDPPRLGTPMDAALYEFNKRLLVDPEQQGDVINLSFMHPEPAIAQSALQKLIQGYMQREGAIFSASEYQFQSAQTELAAKRVQDAQSELSAFKTAAGITAFDDQIVALIRERRDVSTSRESTEVSLEQAVQHRDQLQILLKTVPQLVTNSASGEKYHSMDDAEGKLADLIEKERQMLTTYRADSPMLVPLRAGIATATADLASRRANLGGRDATMSNGVFQSIQTDLLRATADVNANQQAVTLLKQQVADIDRQLANLESHRAGLNDRTRALEIADAAYRAISLHLEDARVAANRLLGGISHGAVVTTPSLPYKSANPRYLLMIFAFAAASVVVGVGMGFAAEFMDDSLLTPEQIMHTLQVPVLATFNAPG